MRTIALALCLLAQAAQPTFKSGVNLVEVDIVVVDKAGQPIRGLKREDFDLTEDGKPVAIETFAAIDLAPAPPGSTLPPPDRSGISVASNDQAEDGRILLIVMDEYHVAFDAGRFAASKAIARRLVERLGPSDLAAVVTTSGSRNAQAEFTTDKARLLAAIDRFFPQAESAGGIAAQRSPGMSGGGFNFINEIKARWAMDTLSNAAKALATIPHRRKAILLVSQGLPVSVEEIVNNANAAGAAQAMRDFIVTAQRSNIAVYPIDPCGLNLDTGCNISTRQNLQSLAENTGGFAVTNTNAPELSVDRMVAENGTYYLAGYASPAPNDGRRHRIRVRTQVRDAQVRARDGYYASRTAPKGGGPPTLDSLIEAPIQSRGLRMHVVGTSAPLAAKPGATIAVGIEMPAADTVRAGSIDFLLAAVDTDGEIRARQRFTTRFSPKGSETAGWIQFGSRVDVAPGRYQIRLAAIGATGETGSVFTEVIVPAFDGALSAGGLTLAPPTAAPARLAELLAPVLPLVPLATLDLYPGARVVAQLPLRASGKATGPLTVAATLARGTEAPRPLDSVSAPPPDYAAPAGRVYTVALPTDLNPGTYRLTVEAALGSQRVSRELTFRVGQP